MRLDRGTNTRTRKGGDEKKGKEGGRGKRRQGRKGEGGGRRGDVITTRLSHFSSSVGFSFLSDSLKMSEIAAGGELFCLWSSLKNAFSGCSAPFTFHRLNQSTRNQLKKFKALNQPLSFWKFNFDEGGSLWKHTDELFLASCLTCCCCCCCCCGRDWPFGDDVADQRPSRNSISVQLCCW